MADKKQLYWQGENPLGGGKNKLVMGDPCPDTIKEDPRYDDWIEDGTLSNESVVNFGKQKQNELEAAGERIIILRDEVESLKEELSLAAKKAKSDKGSAAQKKKIDGLAQEVKDLKNDLATAKTETKTALSVAKTASDKVLADEKVESGDVIAGLQLKIEELGGDPAAGDAKTSGPKP